MSDLGQIKELLNFGVAGFAVFFMYKISSNHVDHASKAIEELTKAIRDLQEWLHNNKG